MAGFRKLFLATMALWLFAGVANAQDTMDDVVIKREHVQGNIYMLVGSGGNIGMSAGEEGVFLVDDQYAPLTNRIVASIREVNDGEIRFVLNTHWHGDHTGGNENLGHGGTLIIAHDNVRGRMVTGIKRESGGGADPSAPGALPVVTFNDQASIFINSEEARAIHVDQAHTDGDSMIWFKTSNVIHTGDIVFNGLFPYIDVESGGNVNGVIKAVELALELSNADTKFIPGHGPVADRNDLLTYRNMLVQIRNRVQDLIDEGKDLDEVIAAKPAEDFAEEWAWRFIGAADLVTSVFNSLK